LKNPRLPNAASGDFFTPRNLERSSTLIILLYFVLFSMVIVYLKYKNKIEFIEPAKPAQLANRPTGSQVYIQLRYVKEFLRTGLRTYPLETIIVPP
jgi:hypothetical protein